MEAETGVALSQIEALLQGLEGEATRTEVEAQGASEVAVVEELPIKTS